MDGIKENDLLRMSMILENSSATTRDRYICKFTESVIFDSTKRELSIVEICSAIRDKFQLNFDLLELERAIKAKNNGRIELSGDYYRLSTKASNQLSKQKSVSDRLKEYVHIFSEEKGYNEDKLFALVLQHVYHCFNSNVNNFSLIIGSKDMMTINTEENSFQYSQEDTDLINDFMVWNNMEKNKLIYSIITSSYEYCLITSNKNPTIPKSIFKNKRFFLDTNIIFRVAGLNEDERQFVINAFVDKCIEVGIKLCYTSAVLDELYRVIDAQIIYIKTITNYQRPINVRELKRIFKEYDINDFYQVYYDWCKEPKNRYDDYVSFRAYLISRVNKVISSFEYVDSSSVVYYNSKKSDELYNSLFKFKSEKRKSRPTKEDSVKTDVIQILYLEKVRPHNANSLWDMNEFIVSADKLLVSWAESQFCGIPMVVIPSVWLSIIFKITGRATEDDYQSFCNFMTLRHFRSEDDNIEIDPSELLSRLSTKTVDAQIKEAIISEILTNKGEYIFDSISDYDNSIEKAFDVILKEKTNIHKEELKKAVEEEQKKAAIAADKYEADTNSKKSSVEYAKDFARRKAQKRVDFFARTRFVPIIIFLVLMAVIAVVFVLSYVFKIHPYYDWLRWICTDKNFWRKVLSFVTWTDKSIIAGFCLKLLSKAWDYMSSEKNKERLCSKYFNQQLKILNYNSLDL